MKKGFPLTLIAIAAGAVVVLALLAFFFLFHDRTPEETYTGETVDGEPHGFGIWRHVGGAYYAGEFYSGKRHGRGTWLHPDGIKYAGMWEKGNYQGLGTLIMPGGIRYSGYWEKGRKHGPGIQEWPGGKRYTGWWIDDYYEGYGLLEDPEGLVYLGEWLNGRKHGQGRAIYPDGSEYFGQWLRDMRHGQGTLFSPDGSIYEGGWSADRKHGEGTITYPDGSSHTAIWVNGELQEVAVESIRLEPASLALVVGGEPAEISALLFPEEATNREVTWESSNPGVATVEDGLVNPVSPGSATITAASLDGGHTAVCNVTVGTSYTPVSGVSLDRGSLTLYAGESTTLNATVLPANASNRSINWSSANPSVAAVYKDGERRAIVRAFNPGTTWVTVRSVGDGRTASCQVTVIARPVVDERVYIPSLIGLSRAQAVTIIENAGLVVGQVTAEHHSSAPVDQVIKQNPAPGPLVNKGTVISLVVSRGPYVPDPPPPDPDPPDPDPPDPDPPPPDPDPPPPDPDPDPPANGGNNS